MYQSDDIDPLSGEPGIFAQPIEIKQQVSSSQQKHCSKTETKEKTSQSNVEDQGVDSDYINGDQHFIQITPSSLKKQNHSLVSRLSDSPLRQQDFLGDGL